MKSSVFIIGSCDSRHVYNFIDVILDNNHFGDITIFNPAYVGKIPGYIVAYMEGRRIQVNKPGSRPVIKNSILKSAYNFFERTIKLLMLLTWNRRHYDYCFIHYCSWQAMTWVSLFGRHFDHIFPVVYGGDVLRNKSLNKWYYRSVFCKSDIIVLPNENSLRVFNEKTYSYYSDKLKVIQFPQKMVRSFLEAEKSMLSNESIKKEFNFPQDKLIVICGHTATRAERYEQIIEQIETMSQKVKDQCFFVFMMTYAPEEYKSYQKEIEEQLQKSALHYVILKEYLDYDKIQRLHNVSDIHITNIWTDAFSCFLQEEMLSGSILIYGRWLNYFEIESPNFYAIPYDNISLLGEMMEKTIMDFERQKTMSVINRQGIIDLASEESIHVAWNKILNKTTYSKR